MPRSDTPTMPSDAAVRPRPAIDDPRRSFQGLILTLQRYWAQQGCVVLSPTTWRWAPAPSIRRRRCARSARAARPPTCKLSCPKDGRYGENPNRLQHYYQFQVILKPNPPNLQELYVRSLQAIGIDTSVHDVRFVEDDWESPTLGAWGLGWECWCDGMEVSQFTYFQQVTGFECAPVSGELTYGLERLAMYLQGVESIYDLNFNGLEGEGRSTTATSSCRRSRNIRGTTSNTPIPPCCSAISGTRRPPAGPILMPASRSPARTPTAT